MPFILVVAQDTDHAQAAAAFIESEKFFKGRFKDKVAEVHSALARRGKRGGDAAPCGAGTGRPHRDRHSRQQAQGRLGRNEPLHHRSVAGFGVRNPDRTDARARPASAVSAARVTKGDDDEFAAVDRLTVIAHERFDEMIQKAKEPGSIVMKQIVIGEGGDISAAGATLSRPRPLRK